MWLPAWFRMCLSVHLKFFFDAMLRVHFEPLPPQHLNCADHFIDAKAQKVFVVHSFGTVLKIAES